MQKLCVDTGVQEFALNQGVLRFNPSDPNLYGRFLQAVEEIVSLQQEISEKLKSTQDYREIFQVMMQADKSAKQALSHAFGPENQFDALLQGVNLMAVAGNGERVVTNLFSALEPLLEEGAKAFLEMKVDE